MSLAPVILFVYNRPDHTRQTLNALAANKLADESDLYIYADGPKENASPDTRILLEEVRRVAREKQWCKSVTIIESPANRGLAGSVINGVTEVVNKRQKAIVLEDDLVTHPFFLTYMNHYLDVYKSDEKVISIYGYMYPVKEKPDAPFFLKGADCWGWATWKRGWDLFNPDGKELLNAIDKRNQAREFNFNNSYNFTSLLERQVAGQIDSWAIRWYASAFLANKLTLYPPVSLVRNIGTDGSGTHGDTMDASAGLLPEGSFPLKIIRAEENKIYRKRIGKYFRGDKNSAINILKKLRARYVRKS